MGEGERAGGREVGVGGEGVFRGKRKQPHKNLTLKPDRDSKQRLALTSKAFF